MLSKKKTEFINEVIATPAIEADFMMGLTSEQVRKRKADGLYNKVPKKVTKTYWQIFADNVFSFFNIVFFGIAILMMTARLNITYYFFLLPILGNIVMGLITDLHARALVDRLRVVTDPKVRLMREGKSVDVSVDEIVLSDIMVLNAGDQICADGVIVNGRVSLDESLVTGESEPINKGVAQQILSGTYVRSGKAYVRVNRIGIANYAEGLQDSAKHFSRPKSELKASTLKIFWTTGVLAIVLGIVTTISWLSKSASVNNEYPHFIRGLTGSMEAMIPAGLYLLTSLTLGVGVINLAKQRMNVQQLYCIETLARVDTICFDKTGTLTDGKISVKDFYNYSDFTDDEIKDYLASLVNATGDDNSTAKAIKAAFASTLTAEASVPFDSERKYSAAQFNDIGTIVFGAPGFIDAATSEIAENRIQQLTSRGYRVLGVYFSKKPLKNGDINGKFVCIGVLSLSDHVKEDAKPTIAWFRDNGVAVKVISGDNPITVSEISNEVGIPGSANYISMDGVKDEEIPQIVDRYTVFGRVKPEQKALIIEALQKEGRKVAMTGDGVNDIIALKKADCSIAMASGSSAARNVAHMVSLDNDFSKLPAVVTEGRRVINNLQRTASLFLAKTIFAIMVTSIFLVAYWFSNTSGTTDVANIVYPFSTKNLMVWEIVTIGGGGLLLSLQPSKEKLQGSFLGNVLSRAIPAGGISVILVVVFYGLARLSTNFGWGFLTLGQAKTLSVLFFTALSYLTLFQISLPFDRYRAIVFSVCLLVGIGLFIGDVFVTASHPDARGEGLFGVVYQILGPYQILFGVGLFLILGTLYFLTDLWSRRFILKRLKNMEEKS